MASLEGFSQRISRIAVAVPEQADRIVRMAALAADQSVVMATPVDTGRARANWIASLNAPARTTVEPGASPAASAMNAMEQAQGVVAQYDGDTHTAIALSNNLPYIGALNNGSSRQAPANFVSKAVQAAVSAIKGARLLP